MGEVNGEFGTPDWTPVVYIRRAISRSELVALYAAAEVGWVTPLRDGMNLVAKEYVACQRRGEGVLVLSEFAGAAAEMGEAFLVNPYDEERVAAVLERVLDLPAEERSERMVMLHRRVLRNNVFALERAVPRPARRGGAAAGWRRVRSGRHALPVQSRRWIRSAPRAAASSSSTTTARWSPSRRARGMRCPRPAWSISLARLADAPGVTAAIVSGRSRADLDALVRPRAGPVAGRPSTAASCARPSRGTGRWRGPRPSDEWKARVLPVLEHYIDRTPGSFLEEKELRPGLAPPPRRPGVRRVAGQRARGHPGRDAGGDGAAAPSAATRRWRCASPGPTRARWWTACSRCRPDADFRLAIGDDRTDEDLFERLRGEAWTVRVGEGTSSARYSVDSPSQVIAFLEALASAAEDVQRVIEDPARMAAG